jgi:hypothetical protein
MNILVTGCSASSGYNYNDPDDPRIWHRRLFQNFPSSQVTNLAVTRMTNHYIFLETLNALKNQDYDVVVVQFTQLIRFNLQIGLELWPTISCLKDASISLHNHVEVPGHWLNSIRKQLEPLLTPHQEILNIIKYVNALVELQQNIKHRKIMFVNGGYLWPPGFFDKKTITRPGELSDGEQQLLDIESRSDEDVAALYDMIHSEYMRYGGIHEKNWINLYDSLRENQIDNMSDTDPHPGDASQIHYAELFLPRVQEMLQLVK